MNAYVILLRGVNVGGKNNVSMAGLKKLLEALGYSQVSTYFASSTAILQSEKRAEEVQDRQY